MVSPKRYEKKHRRGPIKATLLPIPNLMDASRDDLDVYTFGDGWSREPIPNSFYNELWDLTYRYGGFDADADSRLEVTVVDRSKTYGLPYTPVPYDFERHGEQPNLKTIHGILLQNLSIAQGDLERFYRIHPPYPDGLEQMNATGIGE